MTDEDIIRMAGEAGFPTSMVSWSFWRPYFKRFAALAAAAEREACARVCEERVGYWQRDDIRRDEDENCAAAIRARGS
jgi:hypothetical protein